MDSPVSLEVKISIDLPDNLTSWFHLTHVLNESGEKKLMSPYINGPLCLSAAPQRATTLGEYEKQSHDLLKQVWTILGLNLDDNTPHMIFDHEWWRYCDFNNSIPSLLPALGSIFDFSNQDESILSNYNSLELISHRDELILYLNYDSLMTVDIPKIGLDSSMRSEFALLFEVDSNDQSHDRSLEGVRASLKESTDLELIPTLIFPMPQQVLHHGWSTIHEFIKPHGMHPVYSVTLIDNSLFPFEPETKCKLRFDIDLPKQFIVDKYQLEGLIGRVGDTSCIKSLELSNNGDIDLELPDYKVEEFGSTVHLVLDERCVVTNNGFQLPLHLRYGAPNNSGVQKVKITAGELYWSCLVNDKARWSSITHSFHYEDGTLGKSKLEDSIEWRYYHIQNKASSKLEIDLPVGQITHLKFVEIGTLLVVLMSSIYILWTCWKPNRR